MFIELHEWYYYRGGYLTKPLFCNMRDISNITETDDPYNDRPGSTLVMKNGKTYFVKERYQEIKLKIVNTMGCENDWK